MEGLGDIVGQATVLQGLGRLIERSSRSGVVLDHLLLLGPSGIGKRTVAQALAAEVGVPFTGTDAGTLKKRGELTAMLTHLSPGEVLFLGGVQGLPDSLVSVLGPALTDFRIDLLIGHGPGARVHPFRLNRFTCVMTAPRKADLPGSIREIYPVEMEFGRYSRRELSEIALRAAVRLGLVLEPAAALLVAASCEGLPSRAEALIKRLARAGDGTVTEEVARETLSVLGLAAGQVALGGATSAWESLSGAEFEVRVSSLLERMGFRCGVTRASGDGGVDIVAELSGPLVGGRYLIQCKRFSPGTPVGAPVVRELYGALAADRAAVKGVLITTSYFTEQAAEFARGVGVELIDGESLRRLFDLYGG